MLLKALLKSTTDSKVITRLDNEFNISSLTNKKGLSRKIKF